MTLPAKWIKDNSIKPGDEIEITDNDKTCLKILPSSHSDVEKKPIEIDVSGIDHNTIRQKLRSAYKIGYGEIFINFDKNIVKELRTEEEHPMMELINHEVSNLIGCEVIKQNDDSCLIKNYAVDSELEFNNTLRRVFILIDEYGNSLLEQARTLDKESLKGMRERHFNIAKFIFYCLRLINMGDAPDHNKPTFIYYIVTELDEILDIMKYTAADILQYNVKKLQKETIHLIGKIIEQNKNFSNFYYKPDNKNLMVLTENRWYVIKQLRKLTDKLPKYEIKLLTNMLFILELYYHLCEARMSVGYTLEHP